jgi:hypothetical protein
MSMWMSNLLILVNRNNADRNSLIDLTSAVRETGATVLDVDESNHLIEAAAPLHAVATITAMEGVCYVRSVFNYYKPSDEPLPAAA